MPVDPGQLDLLVKQVCAGEKYACLAPEFIRSIGMRELTKRTSLREAVKSTRNKLHQVAVSYRERPIPFAIWKNELDELPTGLDNHVVHTFLLSAMRSHISTQERLPILESIFRETLQELPPVSSVLDLACGLNPLAIPWMPLEPGFQYFACDIYTDMLAFLNQYFAHFSINGSAFTCDLTTSIPTQPVDLAIALKTIPCLEQVEKQIGTRLLEQVNARHLLVSFPAHSIGGKSKGMVRNYEMHFNDLVAGKPWQIKRFEFHGELVFLITK